MCILCTYRRDGLDVDYQVVTKRWLLMLIQQITYQLYNQPVQNFRMYRVACPHPCGGWVEESHS